VRSATTGSPDLPELVTARSRFVAIETGQFVRLAQIRTLLTEQVSSELNPTRKEISL